MQKLMQSRLFRLLMDASNQEESTFQLEKFYDEFALKLLTRLQFEENHTELYYSLGFVHLKLTGICEHLSSEQGKKCLENCNQKRLFSRVSYAGNGMANYSTE